MRKFDIDSKYSDNCISWHSLYMELASEFEESHPGEVIDEDTIRDKFRNSDGSGLVNKLKSVLNFDICGIAGDDRSERFDMFRILKLLFYIEKSGDPKKKAVSNNYRVQITDVLAKPRLSNIPNEYTSYSVYGKCFGQLYSDVKKMVSDAEEREQRLGKINACWEYITEKIFDYVVDDNALTHPQEALRELERIDHFLDEKILAKFKIHDVIHLSKPEKVLPAFFNLLACHKLLCNEYDRIRISYEICLTPAPDSKYVEIFKKYESCVAKWDILASIRKQLKSKNDDPLAKQILALVSYDKDIQDEDLKHYLYAIDKTKIVASWIEKYKGVDFSNGILLNMLVVIMQELVDNKKNGNKISNDYYGYNNKCRSLMTAVKNPEKADAVILQAWIKKLENRTAVNYGAFDLIRKKREIETKIYEIESIIYSYRNLDDLEFVNSIIYRFVARAIVSRNVAMDRGACFAEKIVCDLNNELKNKINFYMNPNGINVLDMFREFFWDRGEIESSVAEEIAKQINEFYGDDCLTQKTMNVPFEMRLGADNCRNFLLIYCVNKRTNMLTYKQFFEVCSNADVDRMNSLGLEQFVRMK